MSTAVAGCTADAQRASDSVHPVTPHAPHAPQVRYALLGHPNTGRSTLFNRLCGLRTRTANYPGTTTGIRVGRCKTGGNGVLLADLPGTYSLDLDLPESRICRTYLEQGKAGRDVPNAVLVVADATCLARSLVFVREALSRGRPGVVALNKMDLARRRGLTIDAQRLSRAIGCPVVPVSGRSGEGTDLLVEALAAPATTDLPAAGRTEMTAWARRTADACVRERSPAAGSRDVLTDRIDAVLTHPVGGVLVFCTVMTGLFMTIFSLATVPMDLIELLFGYTGQWVRAVMAPGAVRDLVSDGLIAGVAGTLVFLPQICLLFFLISLLEDSGYLARAAFLADRALRPFGLPGHAFVPLLSAHACAIPAMMSARLIPDNRDRLATILVAPFMSCSARLPVYVLLIGFLFPARPFLAAMAFAGCYALGAGAAVLTALLVRRTVVRGRPGAMVLELPPFQVPSIRTALMVTADRGLAFVRNAGTVIVAICVVLWWMSAYPSTDPPAQATAWRAEARAVVDVDPQRAVDLEARAGIAESRHALANSFVGRLGHFVQPVFEPLGYDWTLSIGILSSFAAREVFVSTMIVITGATEDPDNAGLLERIRTATRADGTPVFTMSTAAGLLVFYVLAMQCLPTLAVTRRETGGWRWAALQLVYMTGLAYVAALGVRVGLQSIGIA